MAACCWAGGGAKAAVEEALAGCAFAVDGAFYSGVSCAEEAGLHQFEAFWVGDFWEAVGIEVAAPGVATPGVAPVRVVVVVIVIVVWIVGGSGTTGGTCAVVGYDPVVSLG